MNIHEHLSKIKALVRILDKRDTYVILIIISVGVGSFFLGRVSEMEKNREPIVIERGDWIPLSAVASQTSSAVSAPQVPVTIKSVYVGSKSGTKYHLPGCPGAKMINETNKIWFSSKEEAEKAGYSPAGNCKGI